MHSMSQIKQTIHHTTTGYQNLENSEYIEQHILIVQINYLVSGNDHSVRVNNSRKVIS